MSKALMGGRMERCVAMLFLVSAALLAQGANTCASEIDAKLFRGFDAAFVLLDTSSGACVRYNPEKCGCPEVPCSTFKIWNTLIGLELGLLRDPDAPFYHWDGVRRDFEAWNKDLTLREAFQVSCVPAYQELARRIGVDRMRHYVDEVLRYGNRDISAGIDIFWLTSRGKEPIKISPDQQVELLSRLLAGKMDFKEGNVRILHGVMLASKTEKGVLYGKTGSKMGKNGEGALGWYVGFVESQGKTHIFACAISGGVSPDGKTARLIVEDVLKSMDLL